MSKSRLAETFSQLMLDSKRGDILIRIHSSVHRGDDAVNLARFIKSQVPNAHIFGTTASAIINSGKIIQNQCLISVSQFEKGNVHTAMIPITDPKTDEPLSPEALALSLKKKVVKRNTKLLLTFTTALYGDTREFLDECNKLFPKIPMTGGLANSAEVSVKKFFNSGFVFNENGWSDKAILVASFSGEDVECVSSYSSGVEPIGDPIEITDSCGPIILEIDGKDAAKEYHSSIGDYIIFRPEVAKLFPYVYKDTPDLPFNVKYVDNTSISEVLSKDQANYIKPVSSDRSIDLEKKHELLYTNHNVKPGSLLQRAFIYDRKIVADGRSLFQRIEGFPKAEVLFCYSCISRTMIYTNCAMWEVSAYENSNMCGCLTEGQFVYSGGKNQLVSCTFCLTALGETLAMQELNPYAFQQTDALVSDNSELLKYIMYVENRFEDSKYATEAENLKPFIKDLEYKILYNDGEDVPNMAALNMDIKIHGYNRICMINVSDVNSMKAVFEDSEINQTYRNYISKCLSFAKRKKYRIYLIEGWHVAIAGASHLVSLDNFVNDMEQLQRDLFESKGDNIALVPEFCILDGCTVENWTYAYSSARIEMAQKNVQFYVRDAETEKLDEDKIRNRYKMVNVINYAISHDKILPYYQGIYDNRTKSIHHYEALMRIEGEDGKIYTPYAFLDIARSFGLLYDSLSFNMIKKVLNNFKDSSEKSVSINLGLRDIRNHDIVEYIYDFLRTVEHPGNFIFEILENEDINDYNLLVSFVDKIHELGGLISIDDFGSGYSNLQHVASIHSDFLKIDGSIVRKSCETKEAENLIALISDWKNISFRNVKIIAEFVENQDIQDLILRYSIEFSQGYLFSVPSPELEAKDDEAQE